MSQIARMNELCHILMCQHEWVMSHMKKSCRITYECVVLPRMGWLRIVGSIKLQVSSAEFRLFYRALLQTRLIILLIPLTKATPYE